MVKFFRPGIWNTGAAIVLSLPIALALFMGEDRFISAIGPIVTIITYFGIAYSAIPVFLLTGLIFGYGNQPLLYKILTSILVFAYYYSISSLIFFFISKIKNKN